MRKPTVRFSREWFLYWTTQVLIASLMTILFLWFYVSGLPGLLRDNQNRRSPIVTLPSAHP